MVEPMNSAPNEMERIVYYLPLISRMGVVQQECFRVNVDIPQSARLLVRI